MSKKLISFATQTDVVQRLKGILELGTKVKYAPLATHTRFDHSTSAAKLHLLRRTPFLPSEEIDLSLLDVLFHDIGHTPSSHDLEYVGSYGQKAGAEYLVKTSNDVSQVLTDFAIDKDRLITILKKEDPLHLFRSHNILGTDKLEYTHADAKHLGMYNDVSLRDELLNKSWYDAGRMVVDPSAVDAVVAQAEFYVSMFLNGYFRDDFRFTKRLITRMGCEVAGELPHDWEVTFTDEDFFSAVQKSDSSIAQKLYVDGVVGDAYHQVGSFSAKHIDASILEQFVATHPKDRYVWEDAVARTYGVPRGDILMTTGGSSVKLPPHEVFVGNTGIFSELYPDKKKALEARSLSNEQKILVYSAHDVNNIESVIKKISEKI